MQAASTIELDSTDRFGNNELHTFALQKDFRLLVETAKNNPNLLIQKNQNGQTPLHLIQTISQSVIPYTKKNNTIKNNLLYSLVKINPESLSILDSKRNSLIDLLAISVGEDKEFIKKLAELNPTFVENHKLGIELETIQREFTDNFGQSLGEEDQLPEQQPLLKEEKSPLQSSPTLPIPQEIKQQKQESSVNEDQKSLNEKLLQACKNDKNMKAVLLVRKGANPNALCQNGESAISYAKTTGNNKLVAELQKEENKKNHTEIITPLTPITIRKKDQDGNTRIHKLIKAKRVTELKKFIEENTEILKATPIIDDFQSIPAICLKNDRGENPLHMMLLDLDTWGDELIIQIAKLHPGMIHVEDNFGIIPFDLTQPKSNLEKAFIELDPLANNFGKARKIDIEENNQNNQKGKQPIQEIRRRKVPDEGKIITVNQSLPVFQPKQNSLPKYAAYGGLIGAGIGAGGMLIGIGIGCAIAGSLVFPPLGLALVVIGACAALGLATGATYSKKDVITNKLATVFHKGTADNKTFIMEPDTHLKNT